MENKEDVFLKIKKRFPNARRLIQLLNENNPEVVEIIDELKGLINGADDELTKVDAQKFIDVLMPLQ